ncbi:MAG: hypothetical protein JWO15_425 [Sphingomonadales bacterium]|nr:hypothetical protein [Sphingomonadales bacterium]
MTILVGVKCKDGIVIGADSIATSAMGFNPLVQLLSNDKLQKVGNYGIMASTGSVGLSQRFKAILDAQWTAGNHTKSDPVKYMSEIAQLMVADCNATGVPRSNHGGLGFGALLAMIIKNKPYLIEFGTSDFQPEIKQGRLFSVAIGGGQVLADPFLAFVSRVLWEDAEPTVEMAKIGVYWVLDHTIKYAPGGVGEPIRLGVVRQINGQWTSEILDDAQEQAQFIQELESNICPKKSVDAAPATAVPTLGTLA